MVWCVTDLQQLENHGLLISGLSVSCHQLWAIPKIKPTCSSPTSSSSSYTLHFENVWKENFNIFEEPFFKVLVTHDMVNNVEQAQGPFSWNWHPSMRRWSMHDSNKWPRVTKAARKKIKPRLVIWVSRVEATLCGMVRKPLREVMFELRPENEQNVREQHLGAGIVC